MLIWSAPLHAKSLEKYGSGVYNINPATAVVLRAVHARGVQPGPRVVVMVANTNYTGTLKPMTDKLVVEHRHRRQRLRALPGRRDRHHRPASRPGRPQADPGRPDAQGPVLRQPGRLPHLLHVLRHHQAKPFDDKKVRLAFAKAIDREAIVKGILAPTGHPGLLVPDARLPGRQRRRRSSRSRTSTPTRPRSCWPRPASRTARASRSRR